MTVIEIGANMYHRVLSEHESVIAALKVEDVGGF